LAEKSALIYNEAASDAERQCFGRVDLTDGGEKFMLFRSQMDPSDEWIIVEDKGYTAKKFDRQSFEEAMQSLLQ
jgi:hypothetical protein